MKPRSGSAPEDAPRPRNPRAVTEEIHADEGSAGFEMSIDTDTEAGARPRRVANTMKTAEIDVLRDKRATVISPIPAILAEEMMRSGSPPTPAPTGSSAPAVPAAPASPRDPAAPVPERRERERTRRVGDSDQHAAPQGAASPVDAGVAGRRQRAAARIDEVRAALDAGELTQAVLAAEGAMRESDDAPPPGIVEVIEPARPLLTRAFATYVGPLGGVPVLAPRAYEIARARLGDAERAVMVRIDGVRSLEELFDGSGLGSTDALRIAARLLQAGAIRIV
jgi:hypothetical protein